MIACSMENEDPDFQIPRSKSQKKNTAVATKKRFGSPLKDNDMKTGHVPPNTQNLGFELFSRVDNVHKEMEMRIAVLRIAVLRIAVLRIYSIIEAL